MHPSIQKALSSALVLKANPYHDEDGKFTSKDKASGGSGVLGEDTYLTGKRVFTYSVGGKKVGSTGVYEEYAKDSSVDPKVVRTEGMQIDKGSDGKGYATAMYLELFKTLKASGVEKVLSGSKPSPGGLAVWRKLKAAGVPITEAPAKQAAFEADLKAWKTPVKKANPYHDERGRFSSQNAAKFVSTSGVFASRLDKARGTPDNGGLPVPVPKLERAAFLYANTLSGGATVSKASEAYIKSGAAGVKAYYDKRLADVGEKFNPNDPGDVEWASAVQSSKALVDSIRGAKASDKTLYRGMWGSGVISELDSAKPGSVLSFDRVTSFSEEQGIAGAYMGGKANVNYMVELRGSSKTLATDSMTGMTHKEHITYGKFKVVEVKKVKNVNLSGGRKSSPINKYLVVEWLEDSHA